MIYPLLTFFALQFFFSNYWISSISAFVVFIISNSSYKKEDCNCKMEEKPQLDK
jgi:hypothetical protein